MGDPARVLVDPDTVSEDDLRQILAPHSLETVRWVVASTKQTLDDLVERDLFNDLTIFEGLSVYPGLKQLGTEAGEARQTAQTLLTDVNNTLSPNNTAAHGADADRDEVLAEQASLKQRAAGLVYRTGSLVRRTDRALRDAGREAIERARYQSVRIVHNLADAGGYALRLASSNRARQAMRVIVAVVAVGALGVQFIPVLHDIKDAVGQSDLVVSALAAVQALLPEREAAGDDAENAAPATAHSWPPPSQFIIDLRSLKELHADGGLSDEEFTRFKQKIWESEPCP